MKKTANAKHEIVDMNSTWMQECGCDSNPNVYDVNGSPNVLDPMILTCVLLILQSIDTNY